jgi:hypothetical protein
MNSWVLYDLGAQVEQTYGRRDSGLYGGERDGIRSGTFWTRALSLGASAALFGDRIMIALGYAIGTRPRAAW